MNTSKYIKERKLAMLEENKKMENARVQLTGQLNQVNSRLVQLNAELNVLDELEAKLKEKKKC